MFHVTRGLVDLIFIPLNIYSVLLINNETLLHVYRIMIILRVMIIPAKRICMFDSTR